VPVQTARQPDFISSRQPHVTSLPGVPRISVRTCSPLSPTMLLGECMHMSGAPCLHTRRLRRAGARPGVIDLIQHVAYHDEATFGRWPLWIHGCHTQRTACRVGRQRHADPGLGRRHFVLPCVCAAGRATVGCPRAAPGAGALRVDNVGTNGCAARPRDQERAHKTIAPPLLNLRDPGAHPEAHVIQNFRSIHRSISQQQNLLFFLLAFY
jgi:hypothetical protein